ncbi:Calcineurin-like phosphoesterase [Nocardioides alpinus]|uniref:Calcineurin-like phosphoesterase n=2 Tax=Nocardioides alpinus TaxID=748909 RepID=A0A1I1AJY3_9ACTN|nr:hypothetical protein CXG46_07675 [Nocardioides alpinus]SFB38335.1 Calcineurin-like phosphoesterase [Nocardioides alpinus]
MALLVCVAPATLAGPMPSSAVPAATVISVPTRASHDTDLPPRIADHQQHGEDGPITTGKDEGPKSRPAVAAAPVLSGAYRFVSAPDFLNQDVADLTAGGREQHTDPDTGTVANSTNPAYERALDQVLSEVGSHGATDLLVAGDLMEGRWGRDDSGAGVFGPVRTDSQRMAAAQEAAAVYYPAWSRRLTEQGLTPYPALGDHEIGDNPWTKRGDAWIRFKRKHVPAFKQLFASELLRKPDGERRFVDRPSSGQARDTAYAVRLDANVLLVTIDPFTRRHGEVRARVDRAQLKWLQEVLRRARREAVPWVMVQGHTPIAGPVRYRNSSQLTYQGGTDSALWRTMVKGGVDVYLCGEVHDQTVNLRDGILQVAHGSLFYRGEASYLLGQATAKRLVFENHQFRGRVDFTDRLWTTSRLGAPGSVVYPDASLVTGTLEARRTASGGVDIESSEGILRPVRGRLTSSRHR